MVVLSGLLVVGILVAVFVGYNIGGSSTGVSFGPAVGGRIIGKPGAAGLFTLFALWGGWTVGRHVIEKMSEGIVPENEFTLATSIVILFFTGATLFISNVYGVPASTSMTAVGAIVGLGLATNTLNQPAMFQIVSAWIVAPLVAFWAGFLIGRYLYPHLDARFSFTRFEEGLVQLDRSGRLPKPTLNENAEPRDVGGAVVVLAVGCYNAFSAGASNAANAIAPLVGSGSLTADEGIILAIAAIGLGGFTIARRTLDTVGEGLTDMPILAAMIVSVIGATIITGLSQAGIPASLAVSLTSCIIGLGWGRASRPITAIEATTTVGKTPDGATSIPLLKTGTPDLSSDALLAESATKAPAPGRSPTIGELAEEQPSEKSPDKPSVPKIGEEDPEQLLEETPVMFDRVATARVVFLWVLTPTLSTIGAYLVFMMIR